MFGRNINRRSDICGCYYTTGEIPYNSTRHYLPQLALSSHTTIYPLSFNTSLTQTFCNSLSDTLEEARYTFPLYDGVAVTAFSCTIGDRTITGRVKQKDDARHTYDAAVERGETAGLLESLPLGIFATTLGNIPSNTSIIINITYGGELKHDAEIDGLRFNLPTSIAPRYGEYPGELLQPDTAIASQGMHITVDVDMKDQAVRKIQSPSKDHPISVSLGNMSTESSHVTPQPSKASISLTLETAELATDFVLQILVDKIGSPRAILENHPTLSTQALMTTFVPKFNLKSSSPEVVFIADQSGSMQGSRNRSLIAALATFIKSLPVGVRFNICAFGSHHDFLWEKSQPYTQSNVTSSLAYVQAFEADFGGTHMIPAVEAAFDKRLGDMPLEIILLTDGQISQESQLFSLINHKLKVEKVDARVFTLGVGDQVSTTLVEGVSRSGNGFAQFVKDGEVMDQKVIRMLKSALYPHISNFSLEVEYSESDDDFEMVNDETAHDDPGTPCSVPQTTDGTIVQEPLSMYDEHPGVDAPLKEPEDRYAHLPVLPLNASLQHPKADLPLFPYNRTTAFLLVENKSNKTPVSVTLRAESSQGPLELNIPIHMAEDNSTVIHHLAVQKLVQELEEGRGWIMDASLEGKTVRENSRSDEIAEREGVRLGIKYQVANKWCSFVAVDSNQTPVTDRRLVSPSQSAPLFGAPPSGPRLSLFASNAPISPPKKKMMSVRRKRSEPMSPVACSSSYAQPVRPSQAGGPGQSSSGLFGSTSNSQHQHSNLSQAGGLPQGPVASGSSLLGTTSQVPTQARVSSPSLSSGLHRGLFGSSGQSQHSSQFQVECQYGAPPPMLGASSSSSGAARPFGATDHDQQATEVESKDRSDIGRLRELVMLQEFSGCWSWSTDVLECIGLEDVDMGDKVDKQDAATITALVLYFLACKMSTLESVWEMVAEKGQLWLEESTAEEEREHLKKLAESLI